MDQSMANLAVMSTYYHWDTQSPLHHVVMSHIHLVFGIPNKILLFLESLDVLVLRGAQVLRVHRVEWIIVRLLG